jgi:sugar O-acyltransferase (sialic acid O-acetyltransferase NeuD family)
MKALAVVGAGQHGRVVAECAERLGCRRIGLFGGDAASDSSPAPWTLEGSENDLPDRRKEFPTFVVALGDNARRLAVHARLTSIGLGATTLVHPGATISSYARIGAGSVVLAGACVVIGAQIGEAVIVNTAASVDHDCVLGDGVHVSPGAHLAGGVRVGDRSWIGIGAVVRQGICIGRDAVIGAGAVVVADVADGVTVVGNPARPLER